MGKIVFVGSSLQLIFDSEVNRFFVDDEVIYILLYLYFSRIGETTRRNAR